MRYEKYYSIKNLLKKYQMNSNYDTDTILNQLSKSKLLFDIITMPNSISKPLFINKKIFNLINKIEIKWKKQDGNLKNNTFYSLKESYINENTEEYVIFKNFLLCINGLIYINRLKKNKKLGTLINKIIQFIINSDPTLKNKHIYTNTFYQLQILNHLFLISILISAKINEDDTFLYEISLHLIGKKNVQFINSIEIEFCKLLDYKLHVKKEEFYKYLNLLELEINKKKI